jgi:uncharacterized protein
VTDCPGMRQPASNQRIRATAALVACAASTALVLGDMSAVAGPDPYVQEIEAWQKARLTRLTSDEGWLVVSGLAWLQEGDNTVGSGSSNRVVLPAHSVPPSAGVLHLQGGRVTAQLAAAVKASVRPSEVGAAEKPFSKGELRDDVPGPYDVVAIGDVRFFVIDRDGRFGIRIRDLRTPARAAFKGLQYFPVDPGYRVEARFVPHAKPTSLQVPSILGGTTPMVSPGQLRFKLGKQELSLDAVIEADDDQRLFVIFRDTTAGKHTYGAGRFVYTDLPKDNKVVLDFNKAYTPPCAFTAYATCPLPPPQNRLKVAVQAGEKFAGHH